jgi:haloalkane dehalogenase
MYLKKIVSFIGALILIGLISGTVGCASPKGSADQYDKYLVEFASKNTYQEHTLIRKDGHSINVREFGGQFRGDKASMLLMHGFPDNQHLYDLLIPLLAKSRHVVTFDFLGWGKSQSPPGMGFPVAVQVEDIQTVVNELKLSSIDLVMHDLSGQPGIDWALANSSKIAKLVLLNTYYMPMATLKAPDAIEFYSKPGWLRDLAKWGAMKSPARFESGLASQVGKFMSNGPVRDQFVPVFAHSAAFIRPAFFSSVGYLWTELDARIPQVPLMALFDKPVQIIFGAEDPFLNSGVAEEFGRVFKNSRVSLIKGANHYVQLDNASAVADLIR